MTMRTFLDEYKYYLKIERQLSANTVAAYFSDVEQFLRDIPAKPSEVSSSDIESHMDSLSSNVSKRTQARVLSALNSFFDWLILEGERKDNPCDNVDAPKIGRYLPEVLSVEEVESILDSVDLTTWYGIRDRAILEVLYGCGLRVSEAVTLKISDIYAEKGFVSVVGKGDKQRIVPIGEPAVEAVEKYLEVRPLAYDKMCEDILFLNKFGRPLSRVAVFKMVKNQAAAAGVTKEISPHTFRHSFATHLIENGADLRVVQEMLGHENILTTEIYTHIDTSTWQAAVLSHHPGKKT